jgi:SAM-dependent methyltransferase
MTTDVRHDEAGIPDRVREYWDVDSATYDDDAGHHPRTSTELSAWRGALRSLLPAPPARVLDAGAGTGFLSLLLAELGYEVTALDLSVGMLGRLRDKAAGRGLEVAVVEGDAAQPPAGPFDAVVERHLLWTVPAPGAALAAWRAAAPHGRLLLVESEWGSAATGLDATRARARKALGRLRGHGPSHHAEYEPDLRDQLPLGTGASVSELLDLVAASGWRAPRLHRLRDIEWATRSTLPLPERLVGVQARYAIAAD